MSSGFVGAKGIADSVGNVPQTIEADVYIGVFFDGTNNNKVQSMIGQTVRRKEILKDKKKKLKVFNKNNNTSFDTVQSVLGVPRAYWEKQKENVFSKSELDILYGVRGTGDNVFENSIAAGNTDFSWSSIAEDNTSSFQQNNLKRVANGGQSEGILGKMNDFFQDKSLSMSFSQGSTYTNVAILESLYKTTDDATAKKNVGSNIREFHHSLYIEGSGADTDLNVIQHLKSLTDELGRFKKNIVTSVEEDFSDAPASNQPSEKVAPDGIVSGLGFGIGSKGVVEKCRRICEQIKRIYKIYNENTNINVIRLHFDVFGFSRGATTARMFTYILNPSGEGKEPYNICKNDYKLLTGTENVFLPSKKENFAGKLESKEVRCLGIFDTVSSIGILRDGINKILADKMNLAAAEEFASYGKSIYHDDNVSDFGLYSTEKANNLLHICALDENRANFALVDIENSLNTGTEIFMPGCHTDIGGGCALGQDSIKIINYRYIANKEEIFSDAYDKIKQGVEVARSAKATLDSVLALVKNVRKTMQGIAVTSSGVGAVVGVLATIKNARNSYASAKETLVNSYQLATDVNKLIVDAGNQIKTVDEQAAQDAIGKMERESLIEKAINVVTNSSEELNGIKQAVDNMFDDASNIKEAIEGIKGRKSGKDVVDNAAIN